MNDHFFSAQFYEDRFLKCLESFAASLERSSTQFVSTQKLYVDATIEGGITVRSFGPFSDRSEAERALTAFIGRENAMGAVIRNPHA